jgi:hypothetical protein
MHPPDGLQVSAVQGFASSQLLGPPGVHAPALQRSPVVQASPSLQGAVLFVKAHPVAGTHASSVQTLPSVHESAAPPTQPPLLQVSLVVHALPSLQAAVLFVNTHPEAGLHASSVQTFPSLHVTGGPAVQPPALQTSLIVQASPSSQAAALFVKTHPVAGAHESSVHTLPSTQVTAAPLQMPPPQTSPIVHIDPSSQAAVLGVKTHPVAGAQESSVQPLPSLQPTGPPARHVPAASHVSIIVQAFRSLHAVPAAAEQPVAGLHAARSHASPGAGQITGEPPVHAAVALQVVLSVQTSPSSHAVPVGCGG